MSLPLCVFLLPLPKHLLCWADFLMCELNYRFLISSKLQASKAFGEWHGYFITNKKVNKNTIAPGPDGEPYFCEDK